MRYSWDSSMYLCSLSGQRPGGLEVVAERLLDDHALPV